MINIKLRSQLINKWESWLILGVTRERTIRFVIIASLMAISYWGIFASGRYVSEAHVIIQRTDMTGGPTLDVGAFLTGGSNRSDQFLLRDYLLSMDMLNKLDAKLNLRAHYSDWKRDPVSRMWFEDAPQEIFHKYFLSRINVEFDDYAGVLVIKAQGYAPETARAITSMLVEQGERTMNNLAQALAQEQVAFIEKQVAESAARFQKARSAVLAYQNQKRMISPQSTVENLSAAINRLDGQRSELQASRNALLGYLSSRAPSIVELDMRIDAIEKQMEKEQSRLAAPNGKTLNSTVEEFQRLEMEAQFAQDIYKTSLVALERSRIEATRTLKKVSVLQGPTLPQSPTEPRRIYNITVFILFTLLLAGIVHLLAAIIRDHKD